MLADYHLGQEFEANGRQYYIVFVVFSQFLEEERDQLDKAGLGWSGPFPRSAAMCHGVAVQDALMRITC